MSRIDRVRRAIERFVTADGATAVEIADSYCDLYGYFPEIYRLREDLTRLVHSREVRRSGDRFFWHETDEVRS